MELLQSDFDRAFQTLQEIAKSLGADATLLCIRHTFLPQTSIQDSSTSNLDLATTTPPASPTDAPYIYGHVLIRKYPGNVQELPELRICVVGNVDAGKSTLLGVLTKDSLDDGRGKARVALFRHKHEVETGRTSSIGMELMGFDSKGQVVTPGKLGKTKLAWDDVCLNASKVAFAPHYNLKS